VQQGNRAIIHTLKELPTPGWETNSENRVAVVKLTFQRLENPDLTRGLTVT